MGDGNMGEMVIWGGIMWEMVIRGRRYYGGDGYTGHGEDGYMGKVVIWGRR